MTFAFKLQMSVNKTGAKLILAYNFSREPTSSANARGFYTRVHYKSAKALHWMIKDIEPCHSITLSRSLAGPFGGPTASKAVRTLSCGAKSVERVLFKDTYHIHLFILLLLFVVFG
jgi:hypothetical protein